MCMMQGYAEANAMIAEENAGTVDMKSFEGALRHTGELLTGEVRTKALESLTDYIWGYPGKRRGRRTLACGTCRQTMPQPANWNVKHGEEGTCPSCGKAGIFRHEARGHKKCQERMWLLDWRKSAAEKDAVALVVTLIARDSSGKHPENAQTDIIPCAVYVYQYGKPPRCWKRNCYDYDYKTKTHAPGEWRRMKKISGLNYRGDAILDHRNAGELADAIEGTAFTRVRELIFRGSRTIYSRRALNEMDMAAMEETARRPYLEYLLKTGQKRLAEQICSEHAGKIINHREKTPLEILRLTRGQFAQIKGDKVELSLSILKWLQGLTRAGISDQVRDAVAAAGMTDAHYSDTYIEAASLFPASMRRKAWNYLLRHKNVERNEIRDLWMQLRELEEDFENTQLSLPKDVHAAHQRMTERVNEKRERVRAEQSAEKQRKFQKLLKRLEKDYTFEACGLLLRPIRSAEELTQEGKALHHCVGGYADSYMSGRTIICALRRASAPDAPWRTIELSPKTGKVIQDRGKYNDRNNGANTLDEGTRDTLARFWAEFDERKKKKKGGQAA